MVCIYIISSNVNHLVSFIIRVTEDSEIVLINIIKPLKSGYQKTENVIYSSSVFNFTERGENPDSCKEVAANDTQSPIAHLAISG